MAHRPARILTAFDRKHARLFERRFLRSLRAEGNPETVTAAVSGLLPSERRRLEAMPNVEVVVVPGDANPAVRRLSNFQQILARWPDDTPVAHWDAGDVIFQARVSALWDLIRTHPDRLLAAPEISTYRQNPVNRSWLESISEPEARRRALSLLIDLPILNAGFYAATAGTMGRYLSEAERLLGSAALRGSTDWGDQTALNLFCRTNPDRWLEVPRGWNFCLCGLSPTDYQIDPAGRTVRLDGQPLYVVHGAGGSLTRWNLFHLTA